MTNVPSVRFTDASNEAPIMMNPKQFASCVILFILESLLLRAIIFLVALLAMTVGFSIYVSQPNASGWWGIAALVGLVVTVLIATARPAGYH